MEIYKYDSKTLSFKKINILSILIKFLFIITFLFSFLGVNLYSPSTQYVVKEEIIKFKEYNEFSEEKLIKKIKELNFKFPYIVLAQSKLETGGFKSKIFLENNNLYGMKEAKVRLNLAKGTQFNHAYYNHWVESLLDYSLWYSTYTSSIQSEDEFYYYLGKVYAEDENYINKLKDIIKKENLKNKFL